MTERTCSCGARFDEGRYIGPQNAEGGEWLLLHTCPRCETTYAAAVLQDAARCCACHHLIVGDAEDPKIIVMDAWGPARVYCADCACLDCAAATMKTIADAADFLAARYDKFIGAVREQRRAEAEAYRARAVRSRPPAQPLQGQRA